MFMVHEAFKDVFVEVVGTGHKHPSFRELTIRWWNLGFCGKPWLVLPKPQKIVIKDSDWLRWSIFYPGRSEHPGRKL